MPMAPHTDAEMMTRADNARRKNSISPPSLARFLTRREAATALRCSLATLDRRIARGDLRAKKHGHTTFVMASEIERYIEQWPDVEPSAELSAR
jgi:excisionase family DNA binding protein